MPRLLPGARHASAIVTPLVQAARGGENALAAVKPPEAFQPRTHFSLPETVPSWYAGHMHKAMRSLPILLDRSPPPLIIEVRDARLPITSINPAFEEMLRKVYKGKIHKQPGNEWEKRRLVVYTRRDLIDRRIEAPLADAFFRHGQGQQIMFADTRVDADVRKVWQWARQKAREMDANPPPTPPPSAQPARPQRGLSGAFRHTSTPEEGVRMIIVGMPNVGKSSLLNALRRVGTGKAKAASTAPQPGHTRKLTGTVKITKDLPKKIVEDEAPVEDPPPRQRRKYETLDLSVADPNPRQEPAIYVYDTPGVMVPYLGRGRQGAEKGIKLALVAGMKSSLFDTQGLADYLLFRMNLRYGWQWLQWHLARRAGLTSASQPPRALYVDKLPIPATTQLEPTNDIETLLNCVLAPGAMRKGGERDLDSCGEFVIHRWREGKLGLAELDLGIEELQNGSVDPLPGGTPFEGIETRVDRLVREHFADVRQAAWAGANKSAWQFKPDAEGRRLGDAGSRGGNPSESRIATRDREVREMVRSKLVSTNQIRKRAKAEAERTRINKAKSKGIVVARNSPEAKLQRASEKHKNWLVRTGKLKVQGKWRRVHRA